MHYSINWGQRQRDSAYYNFKFDHKRIDELEASIILEDF
jgi:hypothetical protein